MIPFRSCIGLILFALLLAACSEQTSDPPQTADPAGKFISSTGCKNFFTSEAGTDASQGCVRYRYDASRRLLLLTHENAGFNCCPTRIGADIQVEEGRIVVSEWESDALCDCNCLYDLEMSIERLPPGRYSVIFEEPYRSQEDPVLQFDISLPDTPEGYVCVPRTHYPWGM
ncbi:MAG: hypothetical protein JXA28_06990 [Bacteroidetes bacterium]|nr:hypothetical protein [Bacteroidota bacterium]